MLSWPPTVRIFLCSGATDMRKGFDSLAHLVESSLTLDPLSGHLLMLPSLPPSLGARCLAPLWGSLALGPERRRQLNGCGLSPV
jgi:IS66 Orf2 like protein